MPTATAEPNTEAPEAPEEEQPPQLRLPTFEGQRVTESRMNFSGDIPIADQELVELLKLNKEVRLVVTGRVVSRSHRVKRDDEGYVTATISTANIYVEGVSLAED